jgi:hypothetical protein
MIKFTSIEDCENKTFKKSFNTINNNSIVFIFENCYTCFTIAYGEVDEDMIINQNLDLIKECYEEDLIDNNLYTQEEINAQNEENKKLFMDFHKAEYLRLKAIFEPNN